MQTSWIEAFRKWLVAAGLILSVLCTAPILAGLLCVTTAARAEAQPPTEFPSLDFGFAADGKAAPESPESTSSADVAWAALTAALPSLTADVLKAASAPDPVPWALLKNPPEPLQKALIAALLFSVRAIFGVRPRRGRV